jgi:hypothetical protein
MGGLKCTTAWKIERIPGCGWMTVNRELISQQSRDVLLDLYLLAAIHSGLKIMLLILAQ